MFTEILRVTREAAFVESLECEPVQRRFNLADLDSDPHKCRGIVLGCRVLNNILHILVHDINFVH